MYKNHEAVDTPHLGATLWRYVSFTKFVSMLDKQALFFAKVDTFRDPFEGALASWAIQWKRDALYEAMGDRAVGLYGPERLRETRNALRNITLVNCWHENEEESAAMWKVYADEGVAIKTTTGAMIEGFRCSEDEIAIGRVRYIDYVQDRMPDRFIYQPFLHKRRSFEHEREVRAMIVTRSRDEARNATGKYQSVDLNALVQEVVVAPFQPDWFTELVASVSSKYGVGDRVRRSGLDADPDTL